MGRYGDLMYDSKITEQVGEDEKGKYIIHRISEEHYCKCHPETCCHIDGTKVKYYDKKVYVA